jgi:hypothetical protein
MGCVSDPKRILVIPTLWNKPHQRPAQADPDCDIPDYDIPDYDIPDYDINERRPRGD